MPGLARNKMASARLLMAALISAGLALSIRAQAPAQLQVEVKPNQQVSIFASGVSYGDVLRALQKKLGWEIEIPPVADHLELSNVSVEASQPQVALAKLLAGSKLGYAFADPTDESHKLRVLVIPSTPPESSAADNARLSAPINDEKSAGVTGPLPGPTAGVTTTQPDTPGDSTPAPVLSTMPLADAANAIGAPPGVPLGDVGKAVTLPISEAARVMGTPPGVQAGDVGKTTTLPLPNDPGKHP